jgi:hypothetical protein
VYALAEMSSRRDTVRLPLDPLRRRVASATGRSAPFVELKDVALTENALEVTFETPDADVPMVEVVVEGSDGRTETTPVRLDTPSGLQVHGELLRIEYAGRDAETDEILVSVDRRDGDEWRTLLGCGQMWAVETTEDDESVTFTCRVETPSAETGEGENDSDVDDDDVGSEISAEEDSSDEGFLSFNR